MMAYFDNAATTFPKPDCVYDFMTEFYKSSGGNYGRGNSSQAKSSGVIINETRNLLLELFHCPANQVIFTPSATIALNMIIHGLVFKGAINIYISPFEHNAVTRVLHAMEKTHGIKVHVLDCDEDLNYDFEKIKYAFEENKPDLVIVSHVSNVIGLISPVEKIFEIAKSFNAVTVADCSQSAGLVDLNLSQNFDFAVFAGHKTLYGPTGISGFIMKKDFNLPSVLFGGTGFESLNQDMPSSLPEKFEMGTQNILGIAGLNASLKWIKEIGVQKLFEKEVQNRKCLLEFFEKYDFIKVVGNSQNQNFTGIVSILLDGISSDSASAVFSERNISVRTGLQCAPFAHKFLGTSPAGTIRFSTGWFTNDKDFEELENALKDIEDLM